MGCEEFRQELLEQVSQRAGASHYGEAVQDAEHARAERLVVAGLKRLGRNEVDLEARRKGEPRKVELAGELRSATTMPVAWIAARLRIGTHGHLAWLLGRARSVGKSKSPAQGVLGISQSH